MRRKENERRIEKIAARGRESVAEMVTDIEAYARNMVTHGLGIVQLMAALNKQLEFRGVQTPWVDTPWVDTHRPAARPTSRRCKHWLESEKKTLEPHIERLLTDSPGLTGTALRKHLRVVNPICIAVLRGMVERRALRRVKIAVTFGNGMVRKLWGYALPLQMVAAKRAA